MQPSNLRTVIVFGLAAWLAACSGGASPASGRLATSQPATPSAAATVALPTGTYQAVFTPLQGTGIGGLSVTPKAIAQGTFDADIKVHIQNARPNTAYTVQRAPELGRSLAADGVCQRALGLAPWGPSDAPAPAFVTFMNGTAPYTVTTDGAGSGSLEFEFAAPTIPAGTLFDVMFRLVDNVEAPTLEIRSNCFTVTAK